MFKANTDTEILGDVYEVRLDDPKEIFGRPHPIYYITLEFPNKGMFDELQRAYMDAAGWNANIDFSGWPKDQTLLRFETILKPKFGIDSETRQPLAAADVINPGDPARVEFRTECDWSDDRLTLYPVLQYRFVQKVDLNAVWENLPISECEQRVIDKHGQTFDF